MFAQDIDRILIVINIIKSNDGPCNGFSHLKKRESIVVLVEPYM